VDPSIWFIGKSGRPEWVVVRAALFPDEEPKRPDRWEAIARGCSHLSSIGHFAPVGIRGVDRTRPYRGHELHLELQGLG
jgi:hypothetical protein